MRRWGPAITGPSQQTGDKRATPSPRPPPTSREAMSVPSRPLTLLLLLLRLLRLRLLLLRRLHLLLHLLLLLRWGLLLKALRRSASASGGRRSGSRRCRGLLLLNPRREVGRRL